MRLTWTVKPKPIHKPCYGSPFSLWGQVINTINQKENVMKKIVAVPAILLFVMLSTYLYSMAQDKPHKEASVMITLRDGTQYNTASTDNKLGMAYDIYFTGVDDNKKTISLSKETIMNSVKEIHLLTSGIDYGDERGKALIVTQDDKRISLKGVKVSRSKTKYVSLRSFFGYQYSNSITGENETEIIPIHNVKSIFILRSTPKKSPKTGMLFPPTYYYDPYTGEKLQ